MSIDVNAARLADAVALTVPSGWRGRWEVRATVRKSYVIVRR
jgi:uncharacterized cupin superfamily protein